MNQVSQRWQNTQKVAVGGTRELTWFFPKPKVCIVGKRGLVDDIKSSSVEAQQDTWPRRAPLSCLDISYINIRT